MYSKGNNILFVKLCLILLFLPVFVNAQNVPNGLNCVNALPFCSDENYSFPNLVGSNAIVGPDYGCLSQQPNPVWYYLKVGDAGTFQFLLEQSNANGIGIDVDFAMWGPFSELSSGCNSVMIGNTPPIQCSYSSSFTETIGIGMTGGSNEFGNGESTPPAAQSGDYYILVLTNFSGEVGSIQLTQTAGTGTTDCSIVLPCELTHITANVSDCDSTNNTFSVSGIIEFQDAPETGNLIVEDCSGNSVSFSAPFQSPLNYTLPNLSVNGAECFVNAYFTEDEHCEITKNYNRPNTCVCNPPSLDITPLSVCYPEIVSLNNAILPTSDAGIYSFHGTENGALNKTNNISHFVTQSGTYWVRAENSTDPTCFSVHAIHIEVTMLTFTDDRVLPDCEDNNGEITLHVSGGEPDYTFSIDNDATQQSSNHFEDLEAGIYTVYITDVNGCAVTDTIILNNLNAPTIDSVTSIDPTCPGDCDGAIEVFVSGGTPDYSYIWIKDGDTLPQNSASLEDLCAPSDGAFFNFNVVDANNCKAFYWFVLTPPVVDNPYFILKDFCASESGVALNLSTNDGVFSILSPIGDGATINAETGQISNAVGGTTYTVQHQVGEVCIASFTRQVKALAGPDFLLEKSDPLCHENDGSIFVNAVEIGAVPFEYAINGGEFQVNPTFENISGGIYVASVLDTNGCVSTDSIIVEDFIGPILKITNTVVTSPTCHDDCDGSIAIEIVGGTPAYSIQWYDNNSNVLGVIETVLQDLCADAYSVEVRDSNDCTAMAKITLVNPEIPDPSFKFEDFCENESGVLPQSVITPGGKFSFLPPVDDGATIDSLTGEISNAVGGNTYTVYHETPAPCVENFTTTVTVLNAPQANFEAFPITGVPPLTVDIENNSIGADSYLWLFGDGQESTTNNLNFSHVYNDFGEYSLRLFSLTDEGCTDTMTQIITVYYDSIRYEFPNVFTPNQDGENDDFHLIFKENIVSLDIVILNRWGNIVFESDEVDFSWNGRIHNSGETCTEGVYFYKARMKDAHQQSVKAHGYVHLFR